MTGTTAADEFGYGPEPGSPGLAGAPMSAAAQGGPSPSPTAPSLVVFCPEGPLATEAAALASRLHANLTDDPADALCHDLFLRLDSEGLTLVGDGMELRGDFRDMLPRLKPGRLQHELLVQAAKVRCPGRSPVAVDATAGMGEDSLLLAASGFTVDLYECDAVIAALLRDALRRAADVPQLAPVVARMRLHEANSVAALKGMAVPPDVVFLDPMFPERRKSALVKKKLQLLQRLERPCGDEAALMEAAFAARPRKIVVKRPVKGPFLADIKPERSVVGKAVRFDCIAVPTRPYPG